MFYEGYLNVKTKLALTFDGQKKGPHFNVLWTLIDNVRGTKQNPTANIHERYWNVKLLAGRALGPVAQTFTRNQTQVKIKHKIKRNLRSNINRVAQKQLKSNATYVWFYIAKHKIISVNGVIVLWRDVTWFDLCKSKVLLLIDRRSTSRPPRKCFIIIYTNPLQTSINNNIKLFKLWKPDSNSEATHVPY